MASENACARARFLVNQDNPENESRVWAEMEDVPLVITVTESSGMKHYALR